MIINNSDTALVVIDPQNDVLSEKGVSWGLVGASVKENGTVENLERLFKAAKEQGFGVFISPHYLYPHDQAWRFGGAIEKMKVYKGAPHGMCSTRKDEVNADLLAFLKAQRPGARVG